MSFSEKIKYVVLAFGAIFLTFGFLYVVMFAFRLNSDFSLGETYILYDLGFIALGMALELLGLGLIELARAIS